jgi:hypothetical protein
MTTKATMALDQLSEKGADAELLRIVLSNHLPWRCLPQRAA